jgi:hypothetical protein
VAVDWLAIRNDYINGGGSYRKLAEKYGVNKDTIAQKAKSEGWREQRDIQTDKTKTETIQKTQEKISDALSDEAAAKARIRAKLIRMAENWIDCQVDAVGDTADYRRIVQSCVDMGVFNEEVIKAGETREDDPLTKALKEEAERLQNGELSE